jgi:DNA-binding transcriptional MerR regulator
MSTADEPRLTLGRLARASGLARASLLHYESLGLLVPAGRSTAGYRLYGEPELARLQAIQLYRDAGLSLAAICRLLGVAGEGRHVRENRGAEILEARLLALANDVARLKKQQQQLAHLLASPEFRDGQNCASKAEWVAMLARAGFSEEDMMAWHARFEADNPEAHEEFLQTLGLAAAEIEEIRKRSR